MLNKQKSILTQTILFALLMLALIAFVYFFKIPNPNMILVAVLVLSTAIGGFVPGLVCAVLMTVYSMYFFSTDHSFFRFEEQNLSKMIVVLLGVLINFLSVAYLKKNRDRVGSQLVETNAKLEQTNDELKKVNDLLKKIASNDPLTNLRNRYSLRQDFEMYVGVPIHLAFLDLDNFKTVNDTSGHMEGDKILTKVGKALIESFRTANCYRYGGDEFLIIAEGMTEDEFLNAYRQTCRTLNAAGVRFSGGYVSGTPETILELRGMIMQADEMLYQSKEEGKNQIRGGAYDRSHTLSEEAAEHYKKSREKGSGRRQN